MDSIELAAARLSIRGPDAAPDAPTEEAMGKAIEDAEALVRERLEPLGLEVSFQFVPTDS
jgi:hypothetical protein